MASYAYISEQVHLRGLLLDPEHVVALFFSSVDEKQMRLVDDAEKWLAASGKRAVLVDGYRNAKMVEKSIRIWYINNQRCSFDRDGNVEPRR